MLMRVTQSKKHENLLEIIGGAAPRLSKFLMGL